MIVTGLFIYPVKSLAGIEVKEALLEERGLQYDRRWMLIDENNRFMTQREFPEMALLGTDITADGIVIMAKDGKVEPLIIPFHVHDGQRISVTIWDDICDANLVSTAADAWFSKVLGKPLRLVHMPDDSIRKVDRAYASNDEITGFSDGYPLLMVGESSLSDLNQRLEVPLSMDRFRPNIVFNGGLPYQEDEMESFLISGIRLLGVKPCARCIMTTTDQKTGKRGDEPLKTLSTYRKKANKVLFGQNVLPAGTGMIRVGDEITDILP